MISGLILLLGGLQFLQASLWRLSGPRIERTLQSLSSSPGRAALTGLVASAFTQSSTAVSLITIGLVHSRLVSLVQAIALILGANVGTTLTVQFLSWNSEILGFPLLGAGLFLSLAPGPRKKIGPLLAATGIIFLGLASVSHGLEPGQYSTWLVAQLNAADKSPLIALGLATLFTAFLHSSSAATGITMSLYAQGIIDPETALAFILGNNIGTCFTALIASFASSTAGKRVAAAHLLVNLIGAIVFLPLIPHFSRFVSTTSIDASRQVANAHTIYNLVCSILIYPFCRPFAWILTRLIPD